MQTLTLIRGLPGSGKSTLARTLSSETGAVHFEADMFFINAKGTYHFRPSLLPKAHQWCETESLKALKRGKSVIVSNTFIERWEMQAYLDMASSVPCTLKVIECSKQYDNIHQVPQKTIDKMKQRWQEIDVEREVR